MEDVSILKEINKDSKMGMDSLSIILKKIEDEEKRNIPYEIRKAIKEKKDKHYHWNYDESKTLNEQNINRKTIAMLSYLNMEYLLNEKQKKLMEEIHKFNEKKIEKEKSEKYNPDSIFKNNIKYDKKEEVALAEVEERKWYEKIFSFIKKILKK